MSIRWCNKSANILISSMFFFTRKNCGILEILGLIMRDACGVVLIRLEYHTICTSDFYKFGISLKRSNRSIRWTKGNGEITEL